MTSSRQDHTATETATLVRPVDALERLFYRYSDRNPVHFMLVAEFDDVLDEDAVRSALELLSRRHPLLQVHVEDRQGGRLGFHRIENPEPVPLRVVETTDWQAVAAEEFVEPFDRSRAPLMRAVLLVDATSSALLLTIDHTIGDGISTIKALRDVLAVLNGETLPVLPVPPSQEVMLENVFGPRQQWTLVTPPDPDPRMLRPTSVREFDGTPTTIHSLAIPAHDTAALLRRCRAERTTVHAAIVTAASRVRNRWGGEDFVRVLSPINFRSLIRADDEVAPYFSCVITGMAPQDGASFWDQARNVTADLAAARSAPGTLAASAGVQQLIGVDADTATAEEVFTRAIPFDLLITNLGIQDLEGTGPLRPTAVWAPVLESQIAGNVVIGITTYAGVLRMVACGYAPVQEFLEPVAQTLVDESA